ncbi:MAG TPA: hypothetical protein VGH34_17695 [Vicinamibacterales bacterium]
MTTLQRLTLATAFALVCATSRSVPAQTPALPPDIDWAMQNGGFSAADVASLQSGQVVTRTQTDAGHLEAVVMSAVRIRTTKEQAVSYFRQLLSYEDGSVTLRYGTFTNPPKEADIARLSLDNDDVGELRNCRPKNCGVRIGAAGVSALGGAIDWRAPDAAERASAWARQRLTTYAAAYLKQGDAALIVYDDQSQPVKLQDMWEGIVDRSPAIAMYAPPLQGHLTGFPEVPLPGGTDELYWDQQHLTSLKTIIGITHMVTWRDPQRPERALIAQKQIYASHYFYGSLAVTLFLQDTREAASPTTYLVYVNRARGDLLKGGFGGLRQRLAEQMVKDSAAQMLGAIKTALER